jgi:zinc protease
MLPMRWLNAAMTAVAVLALGASAQAAAPAPGPATPVAAPAEAYTTPNPEALSGVLPNGLRYTVMSRGGARQASIIMYFDAGAVNERDDESGVAHFLEHMAFNGSPNFPAETLPRLFAGIGVALGRDQNAQTGVTSTFYRLDISEESDAKLDLSFKWLRDVADNLTIGEDQVERERGVILSEYNAGRSPMQALSKASGKFMADGALGSQRDPIGEPQDIRAMTAAKVRGFYEKWYRPDNAIIIIVADAPVADLKARIEATFGTWKAVGPKPAKPDPGHINPARPSDTAVLYDPHAPDTVQVCRGRDVDPKTREGVVTRIRDLNDWSWNNALKNRLDRMTATDNPPFVAASIDNPVMFDTMSFVCISAFTREGDWKRAAAAISAETRRMDLYGVTDRETKTAIAELHGMLAASAGIADTQPAATLADIILRNYTTGGTFSTAQEDLRIGELAMTQMNRQTISDGWKDRWTTSGQPLVLLTSNTPVEAAQVRETWAQAQAAPAPKPVEEKAQAAWAYRDFGPKGKIVERTVDAQHDLVRIRFENGLKVTFKSTQNATDRVLVRIRFGQGQKAIAPADMMTAQLGAEMMQWGGLGKNTYDDTVTVCEGHLCEVGFAIDRDSFLMAGTTRPSDLDVELQVLTAYLVDPGFRPDLNARIPTSVAAMNRLMSTDPGFVAQKARNDAMLKPHVADYGSPDTLAKARATDFARLLKPAMTQDALEVTVIGDIDEPDAMDVIARTLGAIPKRTLGETPPAKAPVGRYPANPGIIRASHDGDADKALVQITWPLFVWTPAKVHESRALDLLADMMETRILTTIRENLGATYSPDVSANDSRGGDEGGLTVNIITTPQTADVVVKTVREIAAQFAAGDFDQDDLERVRKPTIDRGGIREATNEWWMTVLDGSWRHPDQLLAAQQWQGDYEGVTLAEVKAEAKTWLSRGPMVVVVTPRGAAAPKQAGGVSRSPGGS